jgi:hypothetical protein
VARGPRRGGLRVAGFLVGGDSGLVGRIGIELGEELIAGQWNSLLLIGCPLFQVVLVTLLSQRDRLPVPGRPFANPGFWCHSLSRRVSYVVVVSPGGQYLGRLVGIPPRTYPGSTPATGPLPEANR